MNKSGQKEAARLGAFDYRIPPKKEVDSYANFTLHPLSKLGPTRPSL